MTDPKRGSPFLDANHPFFRKAWVRWATALMPAAVGVLEFLNGSPGWGVLFVGAGGWAFYELIVKGPSGPQDGA
jgi:hypothetical protein